MSPNPTPSSAGRMESCLCELRTHDHLCLIYESREEQLAALVPFIRRGLEGRERCFYVADARTVAEIEPAMRAGGIDVGAEISRGALALATERETYLAAGEFDPDAMLDMAIGAAVQAVGEGYGGLRVAGEMSWALGDEAKLERLIEYEVKVNERIATAPALAVCQYDRRRFSPEVIREVIRTHPLVAVGGRVCRNFYYVPPGELAGPDRLAREVDRLLENISEREQAEDALRESERRLTRVLEGSNDAFWDFDVAAGEITWSPRWQEITGASAPPATIEEWRRGVHPDDVGATRAAVTAHLEGRTDHFLGEFRFRGRAGDWRWIQARGRVVTRGAGGRPERMAGTATDVTERRRLQERLELTGRLATVGTLVAGIAHELNNPLAYVSANLRFISERLAAARGSLGGEIEDAVAESLDGAERARGVVQGLRRFAGPAAEGRRAPVDVAAEIAAAVGIVRHQVQSRARLTVDVAEGLPPVVAGLHEVGQVLVNLLVNAAQAIPDGHAAANEVRVTARAADGWVSIEVSDTGQGIASEVLPRIFDPFFTTKAVGDGTGLGLAICHGIVSAAGGEIHVRTEPGGGTAFRVDLPAADRAPAAVAAGRVDPGRRLRVLVVDDEPLVARAISRLIAGEHDVETETSAENAARRVDAGERWDVVLCDLIMPELTGMDLAAHVARAAPELAGRFVFMTGGAYTERSQAFLGSGERRWLEKPVVPDALRALVRAVGAGG